MFSLFAVRDDALQVDFAQMIFGFSTIVIIFLLVLDS